MEQINALLQQELGKLFTEHLDLPVGVFVTIVRIDTSADLSVARVFFSVLPESACETVMRVLNRKSIEFQHRLNKVIVLRRIPKLRWLFDESETRAARIESLLNELKDGESATSSTSEP